MDQLPPDPFLDPVRRRHPDVDVVVLPPEAPQPPDAPGDPDQEAAAAGLPALAGAVDEATAGLWPGLAGEAPPPAQVGFGTDPGTVVVRARCRARVLDEPGVPVVLARLRETLEQQGWEPRRAEGEVARFTGRRAGLRLRASYAAESGALLVEVVSDPVRVGRERASALAGAGEAA